MRFIPHFRVARYEIGLVFVCLHSLGLSWVIWERRFMGLFEASVYGRQYCLKDGKRRCSETAVCKVTS